MIEIDELSDRKYFLNKFEDTKECDVSVAKKKYQKIRQL